MGADVEPVKTAPFISREREMAIGRSDIVGN